MRHNYIFLLDVQTPVLPEIAARTRQKESLVDVDIDELGLLQATKQRFIFIDLCCQYVCIVCRSSQHVQCANRLG
jgi:hypothetical protein